jgi:hypothetical protein
MTFPPLDCHDYHPRMWQRVSTSIGTMSSSMTIRAIRPSTRRACALASLERFYVPWVLETGAVPVFLGTLAYIPAADGPCLSINNQTNVALSGLVGLDNVANFTSLTRV